MLGSCDQRDAKVSPNEASLKLHQTSPNLISDIKRWTHEGTREEVNLLFPVLFFLCNKLSFCKLSLQFPVAKRFL